MKVKKEQTYNMYMRFYHTPLEYCNRSFARSGHMVQNKLCWDASYTVGLPKQRNSYQSSPTFPCFESLTESHNTIYSVTMWPDHSKGLLVEREHDKVNAAEKIIRTLQICIVFLTLLKYFFKSIVWFTNSPVNHSGKILTCIWLFSFVNGSF